MTRVPYVAHDLAQLNALKIRAEKAGASIPGFWRTWWNKYFSKCKRLIAVISSHNFLLWNFVILPLIATSMVPFVFIAAPWMDIMLFSLWMLATQELVAISTVAFSFLSIGAYVLVPMVLDKLKSWWNSKPYEHLHLVPIPLERNHPAIRLEQPNNLSCIPANKNEKAPSFSFKNNKSGTLFAEPYANLCSSGEGEEEVAVRRSSYTNCYRDISSP